jgi:hypothetical protein
MAMVNPSPRPPAAATRRPERAPVAVVVPLEGRTDRLAAHGEGLRREHVRVQLLVDRARETRT